MIRPDRDRPIHEEAIMSTPPPPDEPPTFSHSGRRYLLGYTTETYGIWDRHAPGPPIRKFAKSDAGWNEAWSAYQSLEPPTPDEAPATSEPNAPTTSLPAPGALTTAPSISLHVTGRAVSQVLRIAAWAVLVVLPLAGIAEFTLGGSSFYLVMAGLSQIALGVALWGVCLALSGIARDQRSL